MFIVRVRIDAETEPKTLRIEGEAPEFPIVGKDWHFYAFHPDKYRIRVDMGVVLNISLFADLVLIRTDLIVAEIWIIEDRSNNKSKLISLNDYQGRLVDKTLHSKLSKRHQHALRLLKDEDAARERAKFELKNGGFS